jgi:hypothetical protein
MYAHEMLLNIIFLCNSYSSIAYKAYTFNINIPSFLPLGATAQGELRPPEQSASILLYSEADCLVSEQFNFYGVRLLASRQTSNL